MIPGHALLWCDAASLRSLSSSCEAVDGTEPVDRLDPSKREARQLGGWSRISGVSGWGVCGRVRIPYGV